MKKLLLILLMSPMLADAGGWSECNLASKLKSTQKDDLLEAWNANGNFELFILGDNAYICPCSNSPRIGGASNQPRIGGLGKTARIGGSGNTARIGGSGKTARIGGAGKAARIGGSGDTARIGGWGETARIGGSGNTARIGGLGEAARIGGSTELPRIGGAHSTLQCMPDEKSRLGYQIQIPLQKEVYIFDGIHYSKYSSAY